MNDMTLSHRAPADYKAGLQSGAWHKDRFLLRYTLIPYNTQHFMLLSEH